VGFVPPDEGGLVLKEGGDVEKEGTDRHGLRRTLGVRTETYRKLYRPGTPLKYQTGRVQKRKVLP